MFPTKERQPSVESSTRKHITRKKVLGFFAISLVFLVCSLFATEKNSRVLRAAIDIGTGGPKLLVAEIDTKTNKIVKTLYEERYFVNLYEGVAKSPHRQLSSEIKQQALVAFQNAIAAAKSFHVEGIVAIGTAAFRAAANGAQFALELENQTGIKVHIVDQSLEAKLAFHAALSKMDVSANHLLVWDIGGGSIQFIGIAPNGSYQIQCENYGVGPFTDFIIQQIQGRNLQETKTPNPLSIDEITQALGHAQAAVKINPSFMQKLRQPNTIIVGAGNVFGYGIAGLIPGKNPFTLHDLRATVQSLAGKTDKDLGEGDYAFCEATNAILALGLMESLNIQQVHVAKVNNVEICHS